MLRKVASRVAWVGRTASMVFGLALVLALLFGVASMAFGATGDNFILGKPNVANAITKLTGNVVGGPALQIVNNKTEPGSRGLQVNVAEGKAPIQVNTSAGKATNLNADKLDNLDSTHFFPGANLPRGSTIRGSYSVVGSVGAANEFQAGAIPFGFTLASAPTPHFVAKDTTAPPECPGDASTPEAAPGHLCIYEVFSANLSEVRVCDPVNDSCPGASRYGANVVTISSANDLSGTQGTWAATAP